jgi:hypothetical protein
VFDVISYLLGTGNPKARNFFISGTHVIIAGEFNRVFFSEN